MEVQVHQLKDISLQVGSFCFAPRFCESNPTISVNGHVLHCSMGIKLMVYRFSTAFTLS